jgi:hypothetical protein
MYRIPSRHHRFFLEFGELSSVVDGGEQLPQKQNGHSEQYNCRDHSQYNTQQKHLSWTFSLFLRPHLELILLVEIINEREAAIVVVIEGTQNLAVPLIN